MHHNGACAVLLTSHHYWQKRPKVLLAGCPSRSWTPRTLVYSSLKIESKQSQHARPRLGAPPQVTFVPSKLDTRETRTFHQVPQATQRSSPSSASNITGIIFVTDAPCVCTRGCLLHDGVGNPPLASHARLVALARTPGRGLAGRFVNGVLGTTSTFSPGPTFPSVMARWEAIEGEAAVSL
ncbi:hypothetical protein PV04_05513 [Phialophora macrospora]|uniref:Uncharacterized protein n=1 Tax=Phialophora macrospora TaxID=1851006 RepID=A0A0D2FN37_9EURO|nr:hypothetical protein PV04_05513 [Phialophora macrospora]